MEVQFVTDFGNGMQHIKQITFQGKVIVNSGYTYDEKTETEIISIKNPAA